MRILVIVGCLLVLMAGGCESKSQMPDFAFLDDFLRMWDEFARGRNDLVPKLNAGGPRFESGLAAALDSGDKRAPSRLVFYLVVQVGGFVRLDSELGQACQNLFGEDVPVFVGEDGIRRYYAGDVYYWWETDAEGFAVFPLYEEWKARDLAKEVISMYVRQAKENRQDEPGQGAEGDAANRADEPNQ